MKKKMLCLLLALLMALLVSGCAEKLQELDIDLPDFPTVTPTPEPQPVDPTMALDIVSATPQPDGAGTAAQPGEDPGTTENPGPQILVSIRTEKTEDYDPDIREELILCFGYDVARVYVDGSQEVTGKINETLATLEESFYSGNSYGLPVNYPGYSVMLTMAEDNYTVVRETEKTGMALEFSDQLTARVMRASGRVLSIQYTESGYSGGAHGWYGAEAFNFDVETGELLTLEQLSADPQALRSALEQELRALIDENEDEYYSARVMEDYLFEKTLDEALRDLLRQGSWYFDTQGMVVFSDVEELGPYAAGIVEFRIPYEKLVGLVDEQWLPPQDRQGNGSLNVVPLSELEGGQTEIIDKLVVTENGEELCIVAQGRIYDVSVAEVYYVDRFYEKTQLWYASCLTDCALQLEVTVPEGLPNLLISYSTADGVRHGKLLSQSGLDGSYRLADDDIRAVG
jgi:hypothetical protein